MGLVRIFLDQRLNLCTLNGRWVLSHCITREAPTCLFSVFISITLGDKSKKFFLWFLRMSYLCYPLGVS